MKLLWLKKENRTIKGDVVKELLAMGMPTGLQFSNTAIGSMVMQSANNGLGSVCPAKISKIPAAIPYPTPTVIPQRNPFLILSDCPAPRFWLQNTEAEVAIASNGHMVNCLIFIAAGILLIFAGHTLSMLFVGKSAVAVLDASAKYLRCMGFFYWSLGILNVARMVTQGLGYSGRAVFSGVTEMIARTVVCLGFVGTFGFTAICFADQTAWITATCYIFPTCLWCIRKSTKMLASITVLINNAFKTVQQSAKDKEDI